MDKISIKQQNGVSIITAIFLLVVLSTLGAMMVTFFGAQQQSSTLDMMGSRAYQAANAGVEWAAGHIAAQAQDQGCTGIAPFSAGELGGTLATFSVTIACTATATEEDGTTTYVYAITSTATGGGAVGDANYVERVINVTISRGP